MAPAFAADEPVDQPKSLERATAWLKDLANDADLAADTRVSIPIFVDDIHNKTRLWATLGVRFAKLHVRFAKPPSVKAQEGEGEWQAVGNHLLRDAYFLVLVDEFAEVELEGLRCFDREELRKVCDEQKTKEKIVAALQAD
jgi:hypothetical protein